MTAKRLRPLQAAATSDPEIDALGPWFHDLHLPDGRRTAPDHPLGDFPRHVWRLLAPYVPDDLAGWRVLDVGCNAGFYSFELARRGARVVGIDVDAHYLRQAEWARERLGLAADVTFLRLPVHALARTQAQFDLVCFMGVLYHLRHPLLALDLLRRHTRRLLVFQTLTLERERPPRAAVPVPEDLSIDRPASLGRPHWPRMAFVERRLAGDPTNWWVPSATCAEAMLRSSGFRVVERPAAEIWVAEPAADEDADLIRLRERELDDVFGVGVAGEALE